MKQLGNLAIVCARRKDVTLRIEQGRVMVLLDGPSTRRQRFLPTGMTMKPSCR